MASYNYNPNKEAFVRDDKRGKPIYVNVTEAQRIVSLLDLGYSMADIENKIQLNNPKGTSTTVKSFVKNYKEGNIVLPENAPAPTQLFESMTDNDRIDRLEERVNMLEEKLNSNTENDEGIIDKVKSWMR